MFLYIVVSAEGKSLEVPSIVSSQVEENAPLWQKLLTPLNTLGLAVYFSLLIMGFWVIKNLADDDGSKFVWDFACILLDF